MNLLSLSGNLLLVSFILYLISTAFFAVATSGKKGPSKSGRIAFSLALIGFIAQLGYFFTRWAGAGHAPVSNLYEYTTFFGMMMVFGFLIVYGIYRNNVLGLIAMPVALLVIAYASMFPDEVQPLIPALQSVWLKIHVTTAALGEGILAVSFATGLLYLVHATDFSKESKTRTWLEIVFFTLICVVGYIFVGLMFKAIGSDSTIEYVAKNGATMKHEYSMPVLTGPEGGKVLSGSGAFVELPNYINANKLNTVLWSLISGLILYVVLRFVVFRKRIAETLKPIARKIDLDTADEISYRAVAIGLPVFILGGLIFAMIWAQMAWSRYWGWDPKEVWALITMLFYVFYLHMRIQRGWVGKKSAWLVVGGFAVIMFNLIFVNLVVAGLHSYA
ncbi:c-type cytochrome biogenesis protein CcsB [Exiguobacterium flavidum]|uniref:c-type cytochrome biogenesis protein CcsB n=1 Tax=Exiguobacterium flavidum TaxID=2184695 RepID=UPI000DF7F785|nr:c-type cytochrome biogenesis protein CcsB [Exiguobacterium flavidum]